MPDPATPLRVPVSEGSSTSSRETITILLECGARGGTRRDIARECLHLFADSGPYAGSSEELTPVRSTWISAVPLAMTVALLLASPQSAVKLARGGFGAHLLNLASIRTIEGEEFGV
jgi:hypothetical protein